ncbi:MAG: carbohydrate binding family 9 domain-containing protein [Pseudomonadota bacterium]
MRRLAISVLAMFAAPLAWAEVAIPRTDLDIRIDGVMDEAAWRDAAQIAVDIETRPGENIAAPVQTTAYLIENGSSLFVAFDAKDPDPSKIRAYLRDRDEAYNDDFVGVVLDTYNDEQRAFEFFANALGVQMDLTNDDVNKNEDDSWNAIWDSVGKIGDDGYVVEMEIPLSQIRFPKLAGEQTWGIDVLRFYPREFRYRIANNALDRDVNCYLCQLDKVTGLPGAEPGRDLEITPTLTAVSNESTDDPGIVPLSSNDTETDVGLTVRWGISPDVTANLAINPDFSQIEADVAQLDVNNQFALFFPETRPFFLEGADYFSTPQQIVYTRTVADPSFGAKITGKKGKNTFGAFVTQDEITNLLIPGAFGSDLESLDTENTGFVGRYNRSFGEASTIGALVTARQADDYHNYVGGFDTRWRINDRHNVRAQYLRSDTEYPQQIIDDYDQPEDSFTGHSAFVQYRYSSRNWYANAFHRERSAGFRADSGFVPQVDTTFQVVGGGRTWYGDDEDWWTEIELSGDWDITHDDQGRLLEKEIELDFDIQGPLQSYYSLSGLQRKKLFDDILFEETQIGTYFEIQPTGGLILGTWAGIGEKIDFSNSRIADEIVLEPFVTWNVNQHLLMRVRGSFVQLDTPEGPNIFKASLADVRLTWQFNVRSFLRLTTQYFDIRRNPDSYNDPVDRREKDFGRQLLFSYKLNPQTVFFLGYSDQLVQDDSLDQLEARDRTWFAKIGYAWTP